MGEGYGLSVHWLENGRPIDDLTGATPSSMDHAEAVRHWIEHGRPIDDMTGATPSFMDHYEAVTYWIASLDDRVPAHVPMQEAGLFPAGEFVDAHPVAA